MLSLRILFGMAMHIKFIIKKSLFFLLMIGARSLQDAKHLTISESYKFPVTFVTGYCRCMRTCFGQVLILF